MKYPRWYLATVVLGIFGMLVIACSVLSNTTIGSSLANPTPTLYNAFEGGSPVTQTELLPTIESLMQDSEDCQLPCLWGLRPGETTATDVLEFVKATLRQEPYLGTQDNGWHYYEAYLGFDTGALSIIFRIEDDILVRTELRLIEPALWLESNPFTLPELLEDLGQPTDVYMRINPSVPINYNLAVVYEKVITVEYGFVLNNLTVDDPIPVCAQDHTEDVISVWLQSEKVDSEATDNLFSVEDTSDYDGYLDIEQMANITTETFTEAFAGVPDGCIEALSLRELRESGYR